jgi:hypothetical protein
MNLTHTPATIEADDGWMSCVQKTPRLSAMLPSWQLAGQRHPSHRLGSFCLFHP